MGAGGGKRRTKLECGGEQARGTTEIALWFTKAVKGDGGGEDLYKRATGLERIQRGLSMTGSEEARQSTLLQAAKGPKHCEERKGKQKGTKDNLGPGPGGKTLVWTHV